MNNESVNQNLTRLPSTDPGQLLRYRDRQYAAELIGVLLLHFDFFTWMGHKKLVNTEEIAEKFGFAARPLDVALTLCRANGFIASNGNTHELTQLAREHLVSGSPWNLGPYYEPIRNTPIAEGFIQVLTSGKPANWQAKDDGDDWHESMLSEEFAKGFTALMNCRGISFGQHLALAVTPLIKSDAQTLLDVGGGSGIYASTMVARHPQLSAIVLEQPPVDSIARAEIQRHGLHDRISVLSANMLKDPWPGNQDIILLSNVLHDWDFPEVRKLIELTSNALAPGGIVIIHEAFISNDKTGPLPVAEYSALLMNITQGKCYTPQEYGKVLEEYGLKVGPYHDTVSDRGFMYAVKS